MTARAADDAIALDLDLKDTRVAPPAPGLRAPDAPPAMPDDLTAPEINTATLTTRISVRSDRAVAAQAVRTDGKTGSTVTLVIVTAHAIEAGPGR